MSDSENNDVEENEVQKHYFGLLPSNKSLEASDKNAYGNLLIKQFTEDSINSSLPQSFENGRGAEYTQFQSFLMGQIEVQKKVFKEEKLNNIGKQLLLKQETFDY